MRAALGGLLLLLSASPLLAGDGTLDAAEAKLYFPVEPDVTMRYSVRPRGRVTSTNASKVEPINGKKYTKQTVVISMPGASARPEIRYLRSTSAGLMQWDKDAQAEEILVPFPLTPRQTWVTKAGGERKRMYASMMTKTVSGVEYKDVIMIVSMDPDGGRRMELFYVKHLGLVGTTTRPGRGKHASVSSEVIEVKGGNPGRVFNAKARAWRPYLSDIGSYAIDLPGTPKTRSVRVMGLGPKVRINGHQVSLKQGGETALAVIHYEIPKEAEKPRKKATLVAVAEQALKHVGGKVIKSRTKGASYTLGDEKLRGRELMATVVRSGSEIEVVIRVLHSKTRGFQLIAFGTKEDMPKKTIRKFMSSLRPKP